MEDKFNLSYTDNYISNIFVNYLDQQKSIYGNSGYFTDKHHILNLDIELSVNTLHLQADSFANYMNENNFYYVRRLSNTRNFYRAMYELYIYSYYKCLYLGFYSSQLNPKSDYGLALFGHGYLYHLLSSERNVTNNNFSGYHIGYSFNSYIKKDLILASLRSKFKFLNGLTRIDPFGCSFNINPDVERLLLELQNITTFGGKFSNDENSTNSSRGNPVISKELAVVNDYYEGSDIQIRSLNSDVFSEVFSFKNNVIFNAFYSKKLKGFYYVKHSKQDMLFNRCYFLSRANLISGNFSSDGDIDFNANIYHFTEFKGRNNLNKEHLHMIASDVFAITGIRPKTVGFDKLDRDDNDFDLTDEILDLIDKLIKSLGTDEIISIAKSISDELLSYVKRKLEIEISNKEDSSR
jgi:hypothetical protein